MPSMDRFQLLEPEEFCRSHLSKAQHADGRPINEARSRSWQCGVISTAHGSAMVKQGSTTVVAAIKGELCVPNPQTPHQGLVNLTIEATNFTDSQREHLKQSSNILVDLITRNLIVDLDALCIKSGKWAWILYCDLICLEADSAILDTCSLALSVALNSALLAKVTLVSTDDKPEVPSINLEEKLPVSIKNLPLCTTFAVFRETADLSKIVVDPTEDELNVLGGSVSILHGNDDYLLGLHCFGSGTGEAPSLDLALLDQCVTVAATRQEEARQALEQPIITNTSD